MRGLYWLLTMLILAGTAASAALMLPRPELGYRVTSEALEVDARLGVLDLGQRFPLAVIETMTVVDVGDARRFRGTSAPGLCEGGWSSKATGEAWFATTCVDRGVMLSGPHLTRPIVLSPVDEARFTAAVRSGTPGDFAAVDPGPPAPWWGLLRFGPLLLAAGLGVLLIGSPLRLRFDVGDGVLSVRTLWGRRVVSLRGAAVVAAPEGRATIRLFGVGMPGHQMGRYRKDGRTVQVYLTRRDHSVRIAPADGVQVLLSPEDVAGFVAALVSEGARLASPGGVGQDGGEPTPPRAP